MNCSECDGILTGRQKKYDSTNCAKKAARRIWVLKTYGLTLEEYDVILEFQGGVCALCLKPAKAGQYLHIDHEHGGNVRGLLCAFDNLNVVGKLKDHEKAQRLADYLRTPPAETALGRGVYAPGRPRRRRQPRTRERSRR